VFRSQCQFVCDDYITVVPYGAYAAYVQMSNVNSCVMTTLQWFLRVPMLRMFRCQMSIRV